MTYYISLDILGHGCMAILAMSFGAFLKLELILTYYYLHTTSRALCTACKNSERTLVDLFTAICTAIAVLISTGFYMCNAGDVTIEASNLATAIYFSGWYHCRGQSSVRIRKLIVISMSYAQQPVVFKGLGYIELSYQTYIKIVKASYSVFSVLY